MLNQAHYLQRQAEKATRRGHIAEAIEKHQEAAAILTAILDGSVDNAKASESIRVQLRRHEKERRLLDEYQKRCDHLAKSLSRIKVGGMAEQEMVGRGRSDARPMFRHQGPQDDLQSDIYTCFRENERLIEKLREDEKGEGDAGGNEDEAEKISPSSAAGGTKQPKDDKTIIEELEVMNSHLRRMVDSLFAELGQCQRENLDLKERIRELEEEVRLGKMAAAQLGGGGAGGYSSHIAVASEPNLPDLPPLDVPTFDFDAPDKHN